MRKTSVFVLVFMLSGCAGAVSGEAGRAGDRSTAVPRSRGTLAVSGYCEDFAMKYAENNGVAYRKDSARTEKESDAWMWISNAFQPPGSRFTAGYRCRFRTRAGHGEAHEVSVGIYLTQTLGFAEHTKWEDLQIVPIEYVVDEAHDRAGYGVFKYLKSPLR